MSRKRISEKDSCPFSLNTGVTMNLLPSTSYVEGFFIFSCISIWVGLFIGITSLYLILICFSFTSSWRTYLPNRVEGCVGRSDSLSACLVDRESRQAIVMAAHLMSLGCKRSVPELPLFCFQAAMFSLCTSAKHLEKKLPLTYYYWKHWKLRVFLKDFKLLLLLCDAWSKQKVGGEREVGKKSSHLLLQKTGKFGRGKREN